MGTIRECKIGDTLYPVLFKGINNAPKIIHYKGDISIANRYKKIAIIGSRKCSDSALSFSYQAGAIAAEMDMVVVNGLALGCDTEALRGALSVGGKCIAVMPGGLNEIYPKSNETIADEILKCGGCIISEYENDAKPQKYTFVQRDRLQSALSQGVLIIEADMESGTMHTVEAALKQGRRLATYINEIACKSGNRYAVDKGADSITDENTLKDFYKVLANEQEYEQLELVF